MIQIVPATGEIQSVTALKDLPEEFVKALQFGYTMSFAQNGTTLSVLLLCREKELSEEDQKLWNELADLVAQIDALTATAKKPASKKKKDKEREAKEEEKEKKVIEALARNADLEAERKAAGSGRSGRRGKAQAADVSTMAKAAKDSATAQAQMARAVEGLGAFQLDGAEWKAVAAAIPINQKHIDVLTAAGFETPGYLRLVTLQKLRHIFKHAPNKMVADLIWTWVRDRCRAPVKESTPEDEDWCASVEPKPAAHYIIAPAGP